MLPFADEYSRVAVRCFVGELSGKARSFLETCFTIRKANVGVL